MVFVTVKGQKQRLAYLVTDLLPFFCSTASYALWDDFGQTLGDTESWTRTAIFDPVQALVTIAVTGRVDVSRMRTAAIPSARGGMSLTRGQTYDLGLNMWDCWAMIRAEQIGDIRPAFGFTTQPGAVIIDPIALTRLQGIYWWVDETVQTWTATTCIDINNATDSLGQALDTSYHILRIKRLGTGSWAFYFDGVLVATHATNIPTGNDATPFMAVTAGETGGVQKGVEIDAVCLRNLGGMSRGTS